MNENKIRAAIAEDPLMVLFLGACPAMGASVGVLPALGMGGAVLVIMLLSSLTISALWRLIPENGKVPATVLVVAGFASLAQLLMNAFLPGIYNMLGVYLAVAAVSLLAFSTAENNAGRGAGAAVKDSLLTGLGFAGVLLAMAVVRELLGAGSFAGIDVPFLETYNIPVLTQASGGFIVFAIAAAIIAKLHPREEKKHEGFAAMAVGLAAADETGEE